MQNLIDRDSRLKFVVSMGYSIAANLSKEAPRRTTMRVNRLETADYCSYSQELKAIGT